MTESLAFRIRCLRASFVVTSLMLAVLGLASPSESQVRREGIRRARQPISRRYLVMLRDTEDPDTAAAVVQAMGRGECVTCTAKPFEASRSKRRRLARASWPPILVLPWSRRMGLFIRPVGKCWTLGQLGFGSCGST